MHASCAAGEADGPKSLLAWPEQWLSARTGVAAVIEMQV